MTSLDAIRTPAERCLFALGVAGVLAGIAWAPGHTASADGPWVRYENAHFIGYSYGTPTMVIELLQDMERYRAAIEQINPVPVSSAAEKPIFLVPANWPKRSKRRHRLLPASSAYAHYDGDRPIYQLPPRIEGETERGWVRDLFAVDLVRDRLRGFPPWYRAAFMDFVRKLEVDDGGRYFVIGKGMPRAAIDRPPATDWSLLISEEMRIDWQDEDDTSFAQAWLLLHYLMLGPDDAPRQAFNEYLRDVAGGAPSVDAWAKAFVLSPGELWSSRLEAYRGELGYMQVPIDREAADLDFRFSRLVDDEAERLAHFTTIARATTRAKVITGLSAADYSGKWGRVPLFGQCLEQLEFSYDTSAGTVTLRHQLRLDMSGWATASASYRIERQGKGRLHLERLNRSEPGYFLDSDLTLSQRENGVMCLVSGYSTGKSCTDLLIRCPAPQDGTDASRQERN